MDSSSLEEARLSLKNSGYAAIDGFVSVEECRILSELLEGFIEEDFDSGLKDHRDANMVHNPMFRDSRFYSVLRSSIMTSLLSEVLGHSFILYAFTTSSLPPHGTNWTRRIHVDCPRLIPNYVTNVNVFIPLTDISELNGGIELLPGSHWQSLQPSEGEFLGGRVIPSLKAGSLLIFFSRLWHSGGLNSTTKARHALTLNFCRSYMRQRFDYPRMVPESDIPQLDAMQLQLLGFNVRVPTSLEEYYLPEHKRLYKSNQG